MKLRRILLAVGLFGVSLAASPCAADGIKIGVIVPLSGPFARYGVKIQKAISEFSSDRVSFVFEDEGCDPKKTINAYKKLTEIDHVHLFLGPWCGSPQSAVAPLLKTREQLAVLGASAPEAVFTASDGRMFSTQHSIEAESHFLAEEMNKRGVSSVVIIFMENAFSRAHEAAFRERFKGKIYSTFAYTSEDVSELKSIALKVKKLQPDALYVPDAFPLMAGLARELKAIGIEKTIYSVYSAQSEDVLEALGKNAEQLIYSYPDIDDEALHYFPTLSAKIMVNASAKCGDDTECVRKALLAQNSFDAHGVLTGALRLKTVKDGKFVGLDQSEGKVFFDNGEQEESEE